MTVTMQSLGIDRLPAADRLRLVEEIWDSLSDEIEMPTLSPATETELDRRIAEDDANPEEGSRWEDVKARLQGQRP